MRMNSSMSGLGRLLARWSGLLLVAALTACGGGGGSAGATSGGGGSGGGGGSTGTATVVVTIVNANGDAVTNISFGGAFKLRALVKDANGAVVSGKLVNFSLDGAPIATINPGSALTGATGIAEVAISPSSITANGAASAVSSATVNSAVVEGRVDFSVTPASLSLANFNAGQTSLPSGGNTQIRVDALIGGVSAGAVPVNVTFKGSCGRINGTDATTGVTVTTDGSGRATATYDSVKSDGSLCSSSVQLTASSLGASDQILGLTVASPTANAVTFVSALPARIFVAGFGATEQSVVKFKVLSQTNTPLSGQELKFSIVTNPGGVGLNASGSSSPVTATSDINGEAIVTIFSGPKPGPVKVRAELSADPTVFAESKNLTVASGPPTQERMDLSVETFNIEGWKLSGVRTKFTVRLADRLGNPVDDGTVVNFVSSGGQIQSSCATFKDTSGIASCAVELASQAPRPANGRVTVLAYTEGHKAYLDSNTNNKFDTGDTLHDMGDAFMDANENIQYDAGEFVLSRGGTQTCVGGTWTMPAVADTCDGKLATTIRQQATIFFSSSAAGVTFGTTTLAGVEFYVWSTEHPNLPMPAGTKVSADTFGSTSCAVKKVIPTLVQNIAPASTLGQDQSTRHRVDLTGCMSGDGVNITITSPSGLETIVSTRLL